MVHWVGLRNSGSMPMSMHVSPRKTPMSRLHYLLRALETGDWRFFLL
jgi:hypothetical protein